MVLIIDILKVICKCYEKIVYKHLVLWSNFHNYVLWYKTLYEQFASPWNSYSYGGENDTNVMLLWYKCHLCNLARKAQICMNFAEKKMNFDFW